MRFLTAYFTAILVFLSFALTAQPRQRQQPRPQLFNAIERMASELDLTADQQNQLAKLKTSFEADRAKLQVQKAEEPGPGRTAYHNLIQEYKASIDQVLTEEQQIKLQQVKAEARSQRPQRDQKMDKQGMRSEMRGYRDENITPVMLEQRAKLDTKLSAQDKKLIAELRPKIKAAREEMRQLRQQEDQAKTEETQKLRAAHQADIEVLKGLVQKYETDIDALMAEVAPQQEQWRQDMREIGKKHRPEGGKAYRSGEGKGKKWDEKRGEGRIQQDRSQYNEMPRPAMLKGRFLLLDPSQPAGSMTAKIQVSNLTTFPNPASSEVGIKYNLEKDANVRIELRDREGKLVKNLNQPSLKAGAHSHALDVSQLPDGIYYLAVISQGQQLASKVVVSKK